MTIRETIAALLPDLAWLAKQVLGLLDGLDATEVVRLRAQAEALRHQCTSSHCGGLPKARARRWREGFQRPGGSQLPHRTITRKARRVHAILRFYDFLVSDRLAGAHPIQREDLSLVMTRPSSPNVEADGYLQGEDQEMPKERPLHFLCPVRMVLTTDSSAH